VLRFDFTGLGESDGAFSDSNFSSNVTDLLAASDFLAEHYRAPSLLVGHSLGGAAMLNVADQISSVKAIATINSPADPQHVGHLFDQSKLEMQMEGEAEVYIGGRAFCVKQQFLDDIAQQQQAEKIKALRKAILVMHSPQDRVVAIENAEDIYKLAHHPKSFVTLDGADHLLSNKADAHYAGQVIATWSTRYLDLPKPEKLRSDHSVAVRLGAEGFTSEVMVRHHNLTADEPIAIGGNDYGPTPYELLSASLGACTAMTIQMYARRKKWVIDEVRVHLDHRKDYATDLQQIDEKPSKIDHFERSIELVGDLDEAQLIRLLEIADRCPVHRTLHGEVEVQTVLRR
ncbi:MAG: bifunctional alpha/beta hydrolase/OsmC family protein, partial [Bacteroidota bacterium]